MAGGGAGLWRCKRCGGGSKTPNIQFEKPKYSNVNDPSAARCSLEETLTNRLTLNCDDAVDHMGNGGREWGYKAQGLFRMFHDALVESQARSSEWRRTESVCSS